MDVVGDFITILRNASASKRGACVVQWSTLKENLASILKHEGYINDYIKEQNDKHTKFSLRIFLKYVNDIPAITEIGRVSRPGCRKYLPANRIPAILGGIGECILSTSKGVLSGKGAKSAGVGGELMCYVW